MATISISFIDESNAVSRGYDGEFYQTGAWVMECDGQWMSDLGVATETARTAGLAASVADAKYYAECYANQGEDWTWEPDSAYDPPRDFTAILS